jgi:hypothetical protein
MYKFKLVFYADEDSPSFIREFSSLGALIAKINTFKKCFPTASSYYVDYNVDGINKTFYSDNFILPF